METNIKTLTFVGMAILALCFGACKKSAPPTVKIYDNAISVSYTSANVTGEVTDDGGSPVIDRGFIYGKQGESRQDTMYCGNGAGEFPTRLTNLEPNTTYNCMAFARNDAGMAYSGKATFTTLPMAQPTVVTVEVSNITSTSATCGGNVTSNGGLTVTARGICWSRTNQNPTISDSHTTDGTGTGEFISNITGLTQNATYYVRAYATNSQGTGYGDSRQFTAAELAFLISQGGTVTTTSGKFYDSGGANGNYSNSERYVMTFNSGSSRKIRMTFTGFETEGSSFDYLEIYNGPTTSSSLIGTYGGFNSPGTVTATNSQGALTFVWRSDGSVTAPGWEATITTVP